MKTLTGTPAWPLTAMIADTIAAHGLAWAVAYYYARMPAWQARILIRSAYLG